MEFCKCTFFGHRDAPPGIKASLRQVLSDLIERQGVKQFYVGNQGSFDTMARNLLTEFEQTHGISYEIVLAYLPNRNKWMIDHSDIVITYVHRSFGGAAKFKELAEKKNKVVIQIM